MRGSSRMFLILYAGAQGPGANGRETWTAGIVGAVGAFFGLPLVAVGNLIRGWD
jgi:hypothetical protein